MTTSTHLSISEVMSLLKDDFPDLTITKIRYLESQGLIDPERTASGYRKFYESDIERLRWVLRQQRENFLPLKVIKRRLDTLDGKEGVEAADEPAQESLDLAHGDDHGEPPVWMVDHAKASRSRHEEPQAPPGATPEESAVQASPNGTNEKRRNPPNRARRRGTTRTREGHIGEPRIEEQ